MSVPAPEDRYPRLAMTAQQQRDATLDAIVAWLIETAERAPVLMAWEDLHWADPTTLETLGMLIEQAPTAAMLVVATYRPELTPPWPQRSHMTPITFNRLERPEVETMVGHLAGGRSLPGEVVDHIVAKSDGVPLYVEELTKAILGSGVLEARGDVYVLTGALAQLHIPETLQDSLMARLDRAPRLREVAQLGSVLGREFAYDMISAWPGSRKTMLQSGLGQLVVDELLYQRGRPPRSRYLFKHALIQDAAYQSLLKRTRQQYHQRAAKLLEDRFPEVASTQPELVAHHYTEANCPAQAIAYWHKAGVAAASKSANLEAIDQFRRGLALVEALPDPRERAERELDLQMALGPSTHFPARRENPDEFRTGRSCCKAGSGRVRPARHLALLRVLLCSRRETDRLRASGAHAFTRNPHGATRILLRRRPRSRNAGSDRCRTRGAVDAAGHPLHVHRGRLRPRHWHTARPRRRGGDGAAPAVHLWFRKSACWSITSRSSCPSSTPPPWAGPARSGATSSGAHGACGSRLRAPWAGSTKCSASTPLDEVRLVTWSPTTSASSAWATRGPGAWAFRSASSPCTPRPARSPPWRTLPISQLNIGTDNRALPR